MDVAEVKERTKKKTEDNIESKKHKREKGAVQLPECPHPSVLSAMGLTKKPHERTGVKHPLRIDARSQKGMNFVIVA